MKIFKYRVDLSKDIQTIEMPAAEILTVQMQGDDAYIWAMVSPDADPMTRNIEIFSTGETIEWTPIRKYIGTVQTRAAEVRHIFEVIRETNG